MRRYLKRAVLDGAEAEIFNLVSYGATPEQWADWLRAPLEHAAACGNLDLVNRLLEAGANGRAGWKGCRGRTLLNAAALGGNPDVVSVLLRAGCRPDVNVVSASSGRSALQVAVACGHDAVAKMLIVVGANTAVRDYRGLSALEMAAAVGDVSTMTVLLEHGVDVNAIDSFGSTALHHAARCGGVAAIDILLDAGANVDAKTSTGTTPLHCVGRVQNLLTLLRRGAKINGPDHSGRTALHAICNREMVQGAAACVDLLLRRGASETVVDEDGYTPADCLETSARNGLCSPYELGRVRVLLARAPADRAWRRRFWVVMLRSRAEKERTSHYGSGDREEDDARGCCGNERGGIKRIGGIYKSAGSGSGGAGEGHTDGEEKAVEGGEDWRGVVSALVGLELEDAFRKVVAFL